MCQRPACIQTLKTANTGKYLADTSIIRAMTCDFQQCGILTSVDLDEPVQPPFKLRNSKINDVRSVA